MSAPGGEHDPAEPDGAGPPPLVDFPRLAGRIGMAALLLGALAFVAVVVEGLRSGLTFALMLRWAAVFVAALLLATAVLAAVTAVTGADRAGRRGQRLSGDDVGLVPPRRRLEGGDPEDDEAS